MKPTTFEFWQGQSNRIHDRLKFRHLNEGEERDTRHTHEAEDSWVLERLSP